MSTPEDHDPLAPVEFVVKVLLTFVLVIVALMGGTAVWQLATSGSTDVGLRSFGSGQACVDDVSDVPVSGDTRRGGIPGLDGENGQATPRSWEVCTDNPTTTQVWLVGANDVAVVLSAIGSMTLLLWAVRGARRHGLFTAPAARRTRVLGWFVLVAAVTAPVLDALARGVVLSSVVDGYDWWRPLGVVTFQPSFSYLAVVVGIGIVTFARILERAVPLQEEVDATV